MKRDIQKSSGDKFMQASVRGFFALALFAFSAQITPVRALAEDAPPASQSEPEAANSVPTPAPAAAAKKPAQEDGNGAVPEPVKPQPADKPWALNIEPIFKGPTVRRFANPADLTGRDRQILENLDYKPSGTVQRLGQIRKLTGELKKAAQRSEAALNASLSMLRLYEEQGMVFEWMRVVGITDPKYPDLNATLKNIRRQQAQRYQELILNYPKHPNHKQWKLKLIISRLKLGDPSVRDEAIALLKTLQAADQHELASVGLAVDAAANQMPSPFGAIDQVMQYSTDQYEGAAFKLLLAEQEIAKNKTAAAIPLLQDVIATCKNIRKSDKEQTPGMILQAAAGLLIEAGTRGATAINQEVYQTLANNDLGEYARAYLEDFALKNHQKNLPLAIKAYSESLASGQPSEALKIRIETRILDLEIASNDPKRIMIAWERVVSRAIQKSTNLDSQMLHSMNMVMNQFKAKPDKDLALRLVGLHDSFVRGFPAYAAREDYELRMIELLNQTKLYNEVGRRTQISADKFKDRINKITALQLNLSARSQLMGLGADPKPVAGQKLLGDPALAVGYIANADKLRALLPKFDGDKYAFQAAFIQLTSGDKKIALARFEDAFNKAARHPLAPDAANFLIETLQQRKELADLEKFVRLMLKLGVMPSKDPYRNIAKFLEQVVFDAAKLHFDSQQYDLAGNRFAAFQKEFPLSPNAPIALDRAGAAFGLAKKTEFSLTAYELYLKLYPRLPQAKEIRWAAAETARAARMNLKAAEHYQMFVQMYPQDAVARKASLKAAEAYRDENKVNEALNEYERYLKTIQSPDEQKKTLYSIADLAKKVNNNLVILSALERIAKIVKSNDEVITVNFNLMLMYQKLGRDEPAKKAASLVSSLRPSGADGFKFQSKARFALARSNIPALRNRSIMSERDLKIGIQNLVRDYEQLKTTLLAPCEIPGVDWCALGYYEVSKLAVDLAKMLGSIEPHRDLEESVIAEMKAMLAFNRDKFRSEARSFAMQAEDALVSSGSPDQDVSEKIKVYVQQVKQSRDDDINPIDVSGGAASADASVGAEKPAGGESKSPEGEIPDPTSGDVDF